MVHQVALRWNCFFCARLPSFCLLLLLFVVRYILYTMQNLFTSVYTDVCYKMSLTCLTYWHQLFFISLSLSLCWIVWFSILWGVRITYTISFLAHSHHSTKLPCWIFISFSFYSPFQRFILFNSAHDTRVDNTRFIQLRSAVNFFIFIPSQCTFSSHAEDTLLKRLEIWLLLFFSLKDYVLIFVKFKKKKNVVVIGAYHL